jgi:hypothetical protein
VAYAKVLIHISSAKTEKKNYQSGFALIKNMWLLKEKQNQKKGSESERNIGLF